MPLAGKWMTLLVLMMMVKTASFSQRFVIEGDTMFCVTLPERDTIGLALIELDGCRESVVLLESAIVEKDSAIAASERVSASLRAELTLAGGLQDISTREIAHLKESVRLQKRRSTGVIIAASTVVTMLFITSLK